MTDDNVISRSDAAPLMPEDVMGAKQRGVHRIAPAGPRKGPSDAGSGLAGGARMAKPHPTIGPSSIAKKRRTTGGY